MIKYRGLYRVSYEIDKSGKPCEFTFLPLKLKRGASICRHNETTLNLYVPSKIIAKRLLVEYQDLFTLLSMGDSEGILLFPESKLPEAAAILKPYIKGCKVSPRSKRNAKYN
jgi:hypothetical protein